MATATKSRRTGTKASTLKAKARGKGKAAPRKAAKGKAKAAPKKAAKSRKATDNLSFEDACGAVCKALAKRPMTRTELKTIAPYGNYTKLMSYLMEEAKSVRLAMGDGHIEDKPYIHYELAKGRARKPRKAKK